jgi:hypothetical protein
MKLEIYENNERLDFENISITRYENKVFQLGEKLKDMTIDFSSIQQLKGNKDVLEKAFIHELYEQTKL